MKGWQLAADLRYGARVLRKSPGFTLVALIAIALGVGATTAIFSLFDAVLLRSLPYGNPERMVYMWTPNPRLEGVPLEMSPTFPDVLAWRQMSRSFTAITALNQGMFTLPGDTPQRVGGARVLGNFFQTIEATPQLGRTIDVDDDRPGQPPVAVIGDWLWRSRFGGRADAVGKNIAVDHGTFRIVGVMPKGFGYPHENDFPFAERSLKRTEIWIPEALSPGQETQRDSDAAIGRLRPGVSLARAQAEMSAIEKQLDPLHPAEMRGWQSMLVPFVDTLVGPVRPLLRLLLGAVFLVLLIACGNVAHLMMARAAGRVHEMGMRTALGANRARLVRQMLTESLMIFAAGGALGGLLGWAGLHAIARLNPGDIPRFEEASLDTPVLIFALAVSLCTGLVFGLFPALASSTVNVGDLLRQGGRGTAGTSSRVRNSLIVAEVALAVLLLAGAGLLLRSYHNVLGVDRGFDSSTLTVSMVVDTPEPRRLGDLYRKVDTAIRALPGVQAVGAVNDLPLSHAESMTFVAVDGYPNRPTQLANVRTVHGEYFQAMRIRLLAGRYLTDRDVPGRDDEAPKVHVVSESFARLYFGGRNPIGGRMKVGGPRAPWTTIVGVVADVRHTNLEKEPQPTAYAPSWEARAFAVRTAGPPAGVAATIRQTLRSIDPRVTVVDIQSMDQRVSEAVSRRRFQTVLLTAFAVLAVTLALVGLYGLLAYSVGQRTPEIGVRMALGASRGAVVRMVVRQGLLLTMAGLAVGLGAAFATTRLTAASLYGVRATDPLTFVAVPVLLLVVAAAACVAPAWKAAQIDPMEALRHQ